MKTYAEKLKDPRWQRKRLEVLNRDEFKCTICGSVKRTLHVHHEKYEIGKQPWEYPDDNFRTLCDVCHLIVEDSKNIGQQIKAIKFYKNGTILGAYCLFNDRASAFYSYHDETLTRLISFPPDIFNTLVEFYNLHFKLL